MRQATSPSLAERMKRYEQTSHYHLSPRVPVIVRLDGRAFHTLLRSAAKPFDRGFITAMHAAATAVAAEMQGFRLLYHQSDEVSFLLTDNQTNDTQPWFGYDLQKVVSIAASTMSVRLHSTLWRFFNDGKIATFDGRAFNVPEDDVANYFLWRARDWSRNSLHMYARSFFSHAELHCKPAAQVHDMLHSIGKNWATDLADYERNGTFIDREFKQHNGTRPHYSEIDELVQVALRRDEPEQDRGGVM